MTDTIELITTGGTLDKNYDAIQGKLTLTESFMGELLEQANHRLSLTHVSLMAKDSLEMNDQDRYRIAQACIKSKHSKILITHGTDTMSVTANFLASISEIDHKTIVLTGAMRPFKLGQSDAAFNIGAALMALQLKPSGIYIVMNGCCFSAQHVYKDTNQGIFLEC